MVLAQPPPSSAGEAGNVLQETKEQISIHTRPAHSLPAPYTGIPT